MGVSVTDGDITIESSDESADQIRLALGVDDVKSDSESSGLDGSGSDMADASAGADSGDAGSVDPGLATRTKPEKIDRRTLEGKRKSIQAEIDKDTARRHTAKAEADAEEARLAALRAERANFPSHRAEAPPSPAQNDPEPTIEQFKDQQDPYTAWMRAVSRWEGRQEFAKHEQTRQQQHAQQQREWQLQQRANTYVERMSPRMADPDFAARLQASPLAHTLATYALPAGVRPTPMNDLIEEIIDSPFPDKLSEFFLDHPQDLQRLTTLNSRAELSRAIGRIESRLEAALPGPARTPAISHAKPPIKPVGTSPDVSVDDADDTEDLSEAAVLRHHKRENAKDPRFGRVAHR